MLFDTHAHYDEERFDADRDELLSSMPAHNVGLILNPGCDVETSRKAVSYAQKYPFLYAAVGIHPENINENWNNDFAVIKEMAETEPRVRAIGEIGLDYYWEKDERARARQQVVFARQMELAREIGKPVIVHDRDAHADSLEIARRYAGVGGVFHCFAGSVEMARELLALGWMLSFNGAITFKNARRAPEVVAAVPLERLMIETDSPYLTPVPHRGERNDSSYVHFVAEKIAGIKGIPYEEVVRATTENGKRFFRIA